MQKFRGCLVTGPAEISDSRTKLIYLRYLFIAVVTTSWYVPLLVCHCSWNIWAGHLCVGLDPRHASLWPPSSSRGHGKTSACICHVESHLCLRLLFSSVCARPHRWAHQYNAQGFQTGVQLLPRWNYLYNSLCFSRSFPRTSSQS